ncbi:hypothetical protein Tco_1411703, partial [Tanacetum coccineum]
IISLEREINLRNPQHAFKRCEACGSSTHTTTNHYDIEWFKRGEALQAKKAEILKSTRAESSNANRSKTPTKSQLCDAKYIAQFDEKRRTIFNSNKEVIIISLRVRDVYVLDMTSSAQESWFFAKASKNLNWLWHKRLGKHHRASFKTKQTSSIKKCLHLLHMDLFGPVTPRSINHEKYTLVIVDEYSRVENQNDIKVKQLRTDNVYIHNHKDHLGKFDEKVDDGYLLGYSLVSKAFRVFNTRRQQTKETYHITFYESHDDIKFSRPSVDNINIAENERYPPDEYLHPYEPSQSTVPNGIRIPSRYRTVYRESVRFRYGSSSVLGSGSKCSSLNSNDVSFIEPYESPEPVVLETETSSNQNGQTDQNDQTTQTDEILNDNLGYFSPRYNFNPKSTPTHSISGYSSSPQDRWSQDKHIELVSVIGNLRAGMLIFV